MTTAETVQLLERVEKFLDIWVRQEGNCVSQEVLDLERDVVETLKKEKGQLE